MHQHERIASALAVGLYIGLTLGAGRWALAGLALCTGALAARPLRDVAGALGLGKRGRPRP